MGPHLATLLPPSCLHLLLLLLVLLSSSLLPCSALLTEFNTTIPSDSKAYDMFGWATATSGNLMIVGSPTNKFTSQGQGSAYLFNCASFPCTQAAKLTASDGAAGDEFGRSVAISGTKVVVGALGLRSAYLFNCSSTSCTQLTKIEGEDGDVIGDSVAISGDLVAAISSRGVYVFNCPSSTCTLVTKITLSNTTIFQKNVALDGGRLVMGVMDSSENALVFQCTSSSCIQGATLNITDVGYHSFGSQIAISGQLVLVSAINDVDYKGAVYVFQCITASSCTFKEKLNRSENLGDDGFGDAIAISGSVVALGAIGAGQVGAGAVYLYDCLNLPCTFLTTMAASDPSDYYGLGGSVAMLGWKVAAGRYFDPEMVVLSGSVRWFDPALTICGCSPSGSLTCGSDRQCICKPGWTGAKCNTDVDECAVGNGNCDPNAICSNTPPGSFTCKCKERSTGNGVTCSGASSLGIGAITGVTLILALVITRLF